jgi:hypothetical protein
MWIDISSHWGDGGDAEQRFFMVSFGISPKAGGIRLDGAEVLRVGREFFKAMFTAFVRGGGTIHVHTAAAFDAIYHWPQLVTDEAEVDRALDALLTPREASPHPVVVWFEPNLPRRRLAITESKLRMAASDLELLDELIGSGLPRLFLDEEWADLLADPEDRHWIRT